ncbi:MAG: class I SAM-dependent methyltransferase [Campylobacterota bacterium]|nr:class I SAM-dependent methyltransferase [Campylobacterota bacterium]
MSLDLYARAEHLLGIEESTEFLHDSYAQTIAAYDPKTVLDIGCGRGGLMKRLQAEGISVKGIDLSGVMVDEAKAEGLDVEHKDICEVDGEFDAAVAVFDVLNFMDSEALEKFLGCVANVLKSDGLFIADINTLHGFANVAEGTMNAEDDEHFLSVDAVYSDSELRTIFTLFTEKENGLFEKEQSMIKQYFHPLKFFRKKRALRLIKNENISLYDSKDKTLLVFKKV